MTQYNTFNIKLSNSQFNKLKSGVKNGTKVTLNNSNGETNFPHKLLLIDTQVSKFCKVFPDDSSANIKLLKPPLSKTGQSQRFLGSLLGWLWKTDLSLMKNALKNH